MNHLSSTTISIGAAALSETAQVLETAVERNDIAFVHSHNTAFVSGLESLLKQINTCLSNQVSEGVAAVGFPDLDKFKAGLIRLSEALSIMDRGGINKALTDLQESAPTEKYALGVKDIANRIIIAEYDEAEALVDSMLSKVGK